jgi:S-adenosylmethionine hydrolase
VSENIITLTTDYGLNDHLVGVIKGAILKANPDVKIVDLNHSVIPYDVLDGALSVGASYKYFPPRTIHVVVVDPGVGTERRPILVSAGTQYFIAPDNGVLSVVYDQAEDLTVRHITAEHYFLQPVSKTFHGRDIFAPVAASLAKAFQSASFGEEITDFTRFTLPKPKAEGTALKGVVLREDRFGNLMTNFSAEHLPEGTAANGSFRMKVGDREIKKLAETFAQGVANELVAIVGSSGYIEIAINKGNAARTLNARRGVEVILEVA